jgi:hypothetical protein
MTANTNTTKSTYIANPPYRSGNDARGGIGQERKGCQSTRVGTTDSPSRLATGEVPVAVTLWLTKNRDQQI